MYLINHPCFIYALLLFSNSLKVRLIEVCWVLMSCV